MKNLKFFDFSEVKMDYEKIISKRLNKNQKLKIPTKNYF